MTLGASWDGRGTRFSLYSANASAVELCLFDSTDPAHPENRRLELERATTPGCWELYVDGVGPGQRYGYRVHGPFEPARGHRFNPHKLLADPRAGAFTGELVWNPALAGSPPGEEDRATHPADSRGYVPRALVVDPRFDWEDDRRPKIPWRDTLIYECHVRGATRLHPEVAEAERGSYLGLASPPFIAHLQRLGVTAIELMPVQQIGAEEHLLRSGRTNYFGYSPLGFLAPHAGYASGQGDPVSQFKRMVRRFHRAGIEVLLDVVFNHTPEGDHRGPTLSLRGIDNLGYYLLRRGDPSRYVDFTGCGNTLDLSGDAGHQLVLDALRYWVGEMRVDGFRFDLAPVLGRERGRFRSDARLLRSIQADSLLADVKLIAEPWDLGPEGYKLGAFPAGWAEWNDRFRDGVRAFWRGDEGSAPALRAALSGTPKIFRTRPSSASVNFVTSHDGFTLADLVSYERKHNEANGEGNRDGHDRNLSRNWGVEGATDSAHVQALRDRVRRSLIATLALARGTPMVSHGDELGRSQQGNNNPYCQDNEVTWMRWPGEDQEPLAFLLAALELRRAFPGSRPERGAIRWLAASGGRLAPAGRDLPYFAALLSNADRPLLLLFNGDRIGRLFRLPGPPGPPAWRRLLDSSDPRPATIAGGSVIVAAHSLMVLTRPPAGAGSTQAGGVEPAAGSACSRSSR